MTDKLRPLFDRVLIEIEKAPDKIGSIHIPGTAQSKRHQYAKVVEVGPGRLTDEGRRIEPAIKKGDRVIVGEYSGNEIEVDGAKLVVVREDDILGVVE